MAAVNAAIAKTFGVQAVVIGVGAALTAAFTTLGLDVTGTVAVTLLVASGLFILPQRRARLKRELASQGRDPAPRAGPDPRDAVPGAASRLRRAVARDVRAGAREHQGAGGPAAQRRRNPARCGRRNAPRCWGGSTDGGTGRRTGVRRLRRPPRPVKATLRSHRPSNAVLGAQAAPGLLDEHRPSAGPLAKDRFQLRHPCFSGQAALGFFVVAAQIAAGRRSPGSADRAPALPAAPDPASRWAASAYRRAPSPPVDGRSPTASGARLRVAPAGALRPGPYRQYSRTPSRAYTDRFQPRSCRHVLGEATSRTKAGARRSSHSL